MSNPKERHYWAQLRAALTSGQWRSPHPARTPNGTPIPWPELLRKFNKHCRGYADIAEVSAQTQALALLLGARYADDDEEILLPGSGPDISELGIEEVGVLPEERLEEAMAGYEVLKSLTASKFNTVHLALAYYAFALRRPSECLLHLQAIPDILQFLGHIPTSPGSGLLAPSNYAPSTTSFAGSFASSSVIDSTTPEIRDGRGWAITETIRSICLEGMSLEQLNPSDPNLAVTAYRKALPLLSVLQSELGLNLKTASRSAAKPDLSLFSQIRELWRWVERLLWRAVVLSAKTCHVLLDEPISEGTSPALASRTSSTSTVTPSSTSAPVAGNSLWTWLGHYNACSIYWPPTFRSRHRSTVCGIHLRAFVLRFKASKSPVSPEQLKSWRADALSVVNSYRGVLTATTTFPKAGERNVKVEEFVELAVALWEAGWVTVGDVREDMGATWAIDVLQWSQTLTFNSSIILRQLTRLLYLSSVSPVSPAPKNRQLAKRTLELYIQVVGKAWEASKEGVREDMDTDERWVETLVFGARMLASDVARHFQLGGVDSPGYAALPVVQSSGNVAPSSFSAHFAGHSHVVAAQTSQVISSHAPLEDDDAQIAEIHEALDILAKARERLNTKNKLLLGEVLLAEGIVWGLLGVFGQDPSADRSAFFEKSHAALLRSIETNPTPSAYYHLAISFARRIPASAPLSQKARADVSPEDPYKHVHSLSRALECAGQAVEGGPSEVRHWHLLGLLLTAKENWSGAREVLDRGEALDLSGTTDTLQTSASSGEGGSDRDDTSSGEGDETEEAFVVVGTDGGSASPESQNRIPGKIKHKNSASTVMDNGSTPSLPPVNTVLEMDADSIPPAVTLLKYLHPSPSSPGNIQPCAFTFDQYPPTPSVNFYRHLQIRMSQVTLTEVMEGPEGAEADWLELFAWVSEKHREMKTVTTPVVGSKESAIVADEVGPLQVPERAPKTKMYHGLSASTANVTSSAGGDAAPQWSRSNNQSLEVPIGITISPATPEVDTQERSGFMQQQANIIVSEYDEKENTGQRGRQSAEREEHSHLKKKFRTPSLHDKEKVDAGTSGLQPKGKRSLSSDRSGTDTSKSKKVQQMLKNRVDKGRAGISAVSRKIGHGVVRTGGLRRSNSTPDFHAVLQPTSYQASSIHSRRRLSSIMHSIDDRESGYSRTTTPIPGETTTPPHSTSGTPRRNFSKSSHGSSTSHAAIVRPRNAHEDRLMSELWLMSAATFRRLGKIDQARGAIQEAEVKDDTNPNVWVQLGLYYMSVRLYQHAIDTLQKARFISPDDVSAAVHLSRLYLDPEVTSKLHHTVGATPTVVVNPPIVPAASEQSTAQQSAAGNTDFSPAPAAKAEIAPSSMRAIDLAAGMLAHLTKTHGWDTPEAWYFLSKAYALQGRKQNEREALKTALELSEGRTIRYVGSALGWCL